MGAGRLLRIHLVHCTFRIRRRWRWMVASDVLCVPAHVLRFRRRRHLENATRHSRVTPATRRSHRDPSGSGNDRPGETMTTIHAWFSFESALVHGSSLFRKPGGDTVNVTRTNVETTSKGRSS